MDEVCADALYRRIEQLERTTARWWAVAIAGFAALLLATAATKIPEEIAARRFVVVDGDGNVRARLGELTIATTPALHPSTGAASVRPGSAKPFAYPGIDRESDGLWLYDDHGRPRATLRLLDNSPVMVLYDSNGKKRVTVGIFGDSPALTLWNKEGNQVWKVPEGPVTETKP